MATIQMGLVESRFADIIWQNEPVTAVELAKITAEELNWKKTTCYTVLKRLCEKGIFKNEGGTVTSVLSRSDFYSIQSADFVDDNFGGSVPDFLAAFASRKPLSSREIEAIRKIIDQYK